MPWLLVPAGYCVGSISFGLLVVRRLRGLDLRETGSGNPGATNALRSAGRGPALAVLLLDIVKGAVPILLGQRIGVAGPVLGATAVATVIGHMYPLFHRFRGGKGVATTAGALAAIRPELLLASGVVFALVLGVTRYVSLASLVGVTAFPVTASVGLARGELGPDEIWIPLAATLIAVLVVWRHRANIGRIVHRRERRIGTERRER